MKYRGCGREGFLRLHPYFMHQYVDRLPAADFLYAVVYTKVSGGGGFVYIRLGGKYEQPISDQG